MKFPFKIYVYTKRVDFPPCRLPFVLIIPFTYIFHIASDSLSFMCQHWRGRYSIYCCTS